MDTGAHANVGIVPREVALGMPGLEFLQRLSDARLAAPPFTVTAAIRPVSLAEGHVVFQGEPSETFYNPMGVVHGGWIAILLDTAMGCAVHSALAAGQGYTTIEMKTSFVRPVMKRTGVLRCEGRLLHLGKTVASSEGKVYDADGNLVASGSETCLIMNFGSGGKKPNG